MKIEQRYWTEKSGWQPEGVSTLDGDAQWVRFWWHGGFIAIS